MFLFTNDDNPNGDDPPLQVKSQQRAQDLFDLGIQIELFAVESGLGAEFDVKKFYQEIISYSDVDSLEEEGVCFILFFVFFFSFIFWFIPPFLFFNYLSFVCCWLR